MSLNTASAARETALGRILRTISAANRLLVREGDPQRRLDGICRIAVEHGFAMAWIGLVEPASAEVKIIASAGDRSGYLAGLHVRADDTPLGRGPTGTSIREDRTVAVEHTGEDPRLAPWRDRLTNTLHVASAASPLHDQQGRAVGALNLYADEPGFFTSDVITLVEELAADVSYVLQAIASERARGEARAAEEKLLSLVEHAADWILAVDPELRLVYANAAARESQRRTYGRELRRGEPVLVPELGGEARERWSSAYQAALEGKTTSFTFSLIFATGRREAEFRVAPMFGQAGALVGVAVTGRDVTAEWAAHEALRQSEARFRQLVESSRDGIAEVDPSGRYLSANPAFLELLGLGSFAELEGKACGDVTPQEHHASDALAAQLTTLRGFSDEYEKEYVRADGVRVPVSIREWARRDAAGEVIGRWVSARDLRRQRRAEADLRRMLRAVEQSPVSIVITNPAGDVEYVNPRFTEVTGYTLAEARGQNPRFLKSGETPAEVYRELWARVSSGGTWEGELRNRKKSGELFWEAAQISPIFGSGGAITGYVAVKQDITERKLLEEQLRQAQKMEAVGRLAGGVAHDFNNLLTVIRGSGAMLLEDLAVGHPLRELVEEICRAGERATSLTRQLLAFSRRQVLQMRVLDLPTVVSDLGRMLHRLIGEHIELDIRTSKPVRPIKADPGQLEQVIINLAVNARDAMPSGGRLVIETSEAEVTAARLHDHPSVPPGTYALITVADTGTGMTEEVRSHLFEPFFTTKEKGKGTGLGLATVHGIVQQTGGHIEVESELGRGTTFRLYLPFAPGDHLAGQRSQDLPTVERGSGTVLLVEDDDKIRQLIQAVLKTRGYEVLVASNASEAIRALERHVARIQLVLSDVVMPGGSGALIAAKLRELGVSTPIVFMSGYTDDALLEAGVSGDVVPFISKPFTPAALLGKIAEVLSTPRG